MTERTDLEVTIRQMVAYDILSKPLSSLGQKAARRRDKLAQSTAELLDGADSLDRAFAYVERTEVEKARTLREGIETFKENFPRYGGILEGMIQEKRLESNVNLVYGIKQGFHLSTGDYRGVMRDLGLNAVQADAVYTHLLDLSQRLGKADEHEARRILL